MSGPLMNFLVIEATSSSELILGLSVNINLVCFELVDSSFVLGTSTFLRTYSNVDVLRTNPEPASTWQTRSMFNGTPKISFELEVASITKKFISRPNTSVLLQDFQSMFPLLRFIETSAARLSHREPGRLEK